MRRVEAIFVIVALLAAPLALLARGMSCDPSECTMHVLLCAHPMSHSKPMCGMAHCAQRRRCAVRIRVTTRFRISDSSRPFAPAIPLPHAALSVPLVAPEFTPRFASALPSLPHRDSCPRRLNLPEPSSIHRNKIQSGMEDLHAEVRVFLLMCGVCWCSPVRTSDSFWQCSRNCSRSAAPARCRRGCKASKSATSDWSQQTQTDQDGEFDFNPAVPLGDYIVTVNAFRIRAAATELYAWFPILRQFCIFSWRSPRVNETGDGYRRGGTANLDSVTPTTLVDRRTSRRLPARTAPTAWR